MGEVVKTQYGIFTIPSKMEDVPTWGEFLPQLKVGDVLALVRSPARFYTKIEYERKNQNLIYRVVEIGENGVSLYLDSNNNTYRNYRLQVEDRYWMKVTNPKPRSRLEDLL